MIFPRHRKPGTTLRERAIWGIGGAADNLLYNGLNSLIFPIFNIALGVNPLFLGIASAIPRFFDAISDPLVGNWSDNTRTRHGRRRPFILGGSLLAALFFFLLFLPARTWSEPVILGYFTATLIFFYLSYALFVIPYTALGFELSHDPVERTKVLAWRMYVGLGAGFAIPFLYKACFLFGGDEVAGVKWVALAVAVFVAAVGVLLFFALHEQAPLSEKTLPLLVALAMTFKDRAFLFLAGTFLTVLFGIFVALPLVAYIDIYHVFGGDKSSGATFYGYFQLATTIGGFVGVLLVPRLPLCRFLTTKLLVVIGLMSVLSSWWTFSPVGPWLQIPPAFFFGLSVNGLFLLCTSFLGDICDLEANEGGTHRQGVYAASLEFCKKVAISLSTLLSGVVVSFAGIHGADAPLRGDSTLKMRLAFLVVLALGLLAALLCFRGFERCYLVRKKGL